MGFIIHCPRVVFQLLAAERASPLGRTIKWNEVTNYSRLTRSDPTRGARVKSLREEISQNRTRAPVTANISTFLSRPAFFPLFFSSFFTHFLQEFFLVGSDPYVLNYLPSGPHCQSGISSIPPLHPSLSLSFLPSFNLLIPPPSIVPSVNPSIILCFYPFNTDPSILLFPPFIPIYPSGNAKNPFLPVPARLVLLTRHDLIILILLSFSTWR